MSGGAVAEHQPRSPRRGMCAAVLSLEGVTLGLTTPVMIALTDVGTGAALAVGLGSAAACLLLAGMLRNEAAYLLGWGLQVVAVGLGFVVPTMFFLGGIFALLWGAAYLLGRRIERDREAAYAAARDARADRADPGEPSSGGDPAGE